MSALMRSEAAASGAPSRAVVWSPHHDDQVLVAGAGLRLFKVKAKKFVCELDEAASEPPPGSHDPSSPLELLAANCHDSLLRSTVVDWYPGHDQGDVIAVGHATGTVSITSADGVTALGPGLDSRRDYAPRVARACTEIAFNPKRPQLLAVGMAKMAKEPSLLLWDVSARVVSLSDTKRRPPGAAVEAAAAAGRSAKSLGQTGHARTMGPTELSQGEGVLSLKWVPGSADVLLAGIGAKWLRLFDIRAKTNHTVSTARGAHCLTVDPLSPNTFASFSRTDHAVKIWDMRQFSEPVHTLLTDRREHVVRLAWCPTRPGLLGALFAGDGHLTLYDTRHTSDTELEAWASKSISQRATARQHALGDAVADFNWHPTLRNRVVTISARGALALGTAPEHVCCRVSALGDLCCGSVGELEFCDLAGPTGRSDAAPGAPDLEGEDVAVTMRRRAERGYYATTLDANADACASEPEARGAWLWLRATAQRPGCGVRTALHPDGPGLQQHHFDGGGGGGGAGGAGGGRGGGYGKDKGALEIAVHDSSSQPRLAALELCGWVGIGDEGALDARLRAVEAEGGYERAAALAVFHQDLRRAVKALTTGAEVRGHDHAGGMLAAAISLSGYSPTARKMASRQHHVPFGAGTDDSLWRDTCRRLLPDVPDPALRAALTFLTTQDRSYAAVVGEEALDLADRVGFACRYLSDEHLAAFLDEQSRRATERGLLEGLLIEGFSARGLDIVAAYVDRTADVQTAAALSASMASVDPISMQLSSDPRVEGWLEAYRDLLDQWEMYVERAKFDVDRLRAQGGRAAATQVYVRCTYCNASVIPSKVGRGNVSARLRGPAARVAPRRATAACSGCRRPLPRCSVCQLHLGTGTQGTSAKQHLQQRDADGDTARGRVQQLGWWISWCQRCRHGGHAAHLDSWFAEHNACPVAGCECRCTDPRDPAPSVEVTDAG